ncbi:MAG: DNA repair protein RecN [Bacteroidales bacterium]|nr:DNA repair protein RecN [Bacteroidales bacterium]MDY5193993.1 DNA repair protein RecN [Candidatus Aphodosoma sp.]
MLKHLYISQFAIIDSLDLDIAHGFNVITGQTGAGKSIIMGALALVMGERADYKSIRNGASKCVVEATFDITSSNIRSLFDELDLDYAEECIIRREITANGKSRAFINDTPVNQQQLRAVSAKLIDIHSQHENLLLNNSLFQMQVVDAVAQNAPAIEVYKSAYHRFNSLKKELATLQESAEKLRAEKDYNQFQFNQLQEAAVGADEQELLEAELDKLAHIEDIKYNLQLADSILSNDDAAIAQLKTAEQSLGKISDFDKDIASIYERINSVVIELKDVAADVSALFENTDYDPARRNYVEERLNLIYSLEHKHNVKSCEELIEIYNAFARKLESIDSFDDEINSLQAQLSVAEKEMVKASEVLSDSRRAVRDVIAKDLVEKLVYLGINNAKVEVAINSTGNYTVNGSDEVNFLFSANKNVPLRPISTIASGGEISRVMLAIKSLIVKTNDISTIIFDEIDTGVSGLVAQRMGEMMKILSLDTQVIAITHLPQIAAKGNAHFKVYKEDNENDTISKIILLDNEQRRREIAEMLSGENPSKAAFDAADELLVNDK